MATKSTMSRRISAERTLERKETGSTGVSVSPEVIASSLRHIDEQISTLQERRKQLQTVQQKYQEKQAFEQCLITCAKECDKEDASKSSLKVFELVPSDARDQIVTLPRNVWLQYWARNKDAALVDMSSVSMSGAGAQSFTRSALIVLKYWLYFRCLPDDLGQFVSSAWYMYPSFLASRMYDALDALESLLSTVLEIRVKLVTNRELIAQTDRCFAAPPVAPVSAAGDVHASRHVPRLHLINQVMEGMRLLPKRYRLIVPPSDHDMLACSVTRKIKLPTLDCMTPEYTDSHFPTVPEIEAEALKDPQLPKLKQAEFKFVELMQRVRKLPLLDALHHVFSSASGKLGNPGDTGEPPNVFFLAAMQNVLHNKGGWRLRYRFWLYLILGQVLPANATDYLQNSFQDSLAALIDAKYEMKIASLSKLAQQIIQVTALTLS